MDASKPSDAPAAGGASATSTEGGAPFGAPSATSPSYENDPRASFRVDTMPRGIIAALKDYVSRLRGGDPGGLPAVLGLLVLGVIFATTTTDFLTKLNIANLASQASYISLISLGLVFVLLIGEIDLSAGTTGGLCAAFAAQTLQSKSLHTAIGSGVYLALIIAFIGAIALGVWSGMRTAPAFALVGLILLFSGQTHTHQPLAFLFAVCIGVSIGIFSGTLVARLGIPSFIVTLALFLSWEGVQLYVLNNQSISTVNYSGWYGLTHYNMAEWAGWTFFVVLAGGYLVVTLIRSRLRARAGLSFDTIALVLIRAGAVIVLGGLVTWFLSQNRSTNTNAKIEGVPWAASVPILFMVLWTLVLSKSTWGRHLYAIGGNAEAARRAGIPVERVKMSAFAISSGMAALGGLFLADFSGGATTGLGQGDILLFAVAATVIGGTSLFGGRGKPRDALIGGLVIAMIPNAIHLHGFPEQANEVITGGVLLVAASVDAISRRRSRTR